MKAYERLLNYVKILTPSNENSQTVPSSDCQFNLARVLEKEMNKLGLTDVYLDDKCYLYGKLPAQRVMKLSCDRIYRTYGYVFLISVIIQSIRSLRRIIMEKLFLLEIVVWFLIRKFSLIFLLSRVVL